MHVRVDTHEVYSVIWLERRGGCLVINRVIVHMHACFHFQHAYICMHACYVVLVCVHVQYIYSSMYIHIIIFNEYKIMYKYTCWDTRLVVNNCCLSLPLLFCAVVVWSMHTSDGGT